ncbi:MAG TPA: hypothetical protein VJ724_16110, partial [Tahibacter sp.]|nr:hypothetical protein [Tahibacter sp.]
ALVVGDGNAAFALPVVREPRILPPGAIADDLANVPGALAPFVDATYRDDDAHWHDFRFDLWLARLAAGAAPDPHH